jgi:hypothetical protein
MRLGGLRLCFLCVFLVFSGNAFSLDREAFAFTSYDLNVRLEPEQQRLGVRGKITLRNDSQTPQKIAVLQVSSSLNWRSINTGGEPLQFVAQSYTSDIDHSGALSEAIVTLREAVAPRGTVELEIAYEGVIVLDATRLTRIGAPETAAHSSDWDRISTKFTAVRGVGYVAWYPIATEAGNLSEGNSVFDTVGRWKTREADSAIHLRISVPSDNEGERPELLINATACPTAREENHEFVADCSYRSLELGVPTFLMADYEVTDRANVAVHYLHGHDVPAVSYANAAEKVTPLITEWFGALRNKAQTADLDDPQAAPFESGSLLLMSLSNADSQVAGLVAAHQLAHAALSSPRPWINEGLAHFAQALYLEQQKGRQAALDYMGLHRSSFSAAATTVPRTEDEANRSLINTYDEQLFRSKAMCVWWMLRDMVGDQGLKKALASYHPEQDKEASYMPRLIQAQTQRDLEWFFDDWVYRDRGLPDFKVESAFPRKTMTDVYLVTVTVDNLGRAGAEVPVTVRFAGGEVVKRLVVRGNSKGVIRVETTKPPEEVVLNDGSVPESDTTNNRWKIDAAQAGASDK